jgi:hypothetical protein
MGILSVFFQLLDKHLLSTCSLHQPNPACESLAQGETQDSCYYPAVPGGDGMALTKSPAIQVVSAMKEKTQGEGRERDWPSVLGSPRR